jgi:hypothetical protein
MTTPEQRRTDGQTRREKLEARAPQLIEIVKKGQYFTSFDDDTSREIYLWCELNPTRLFWEDSMNTTGSNGPTSPVAGSQPKNKQIQNCLYIDSVTDILVSQPSKIFEKHSLVGSSLLTCLELSVNVDDDVRSPASPSSPSSQFEQGYIPRSWFLKAKDRLQLEVLVIALKKLLETSGFELSHQQTGTLTNSTNNNTLQPPSNSQNSTHNNQTSTEKTLTVPKNELLTQLTPKQVVKLLIKNHEKLVDIDPLPFLDLLYHQGIPITRVYNTDTDIISNPTPTPSNPLKIEKTRLFFYPDVTKGVLYWGQYRKPVGMLKLYEISELLCGKTTNILKSEELNEYDPIKSITLSSLTPPSPQQDGQMQSEPKYTTLVIVDGDLYELNILMFCVHRLVCHPQSTEKMRVKYGKVSPGGANTNGVAGAGNSGVGDGVNGNGDSDVGTTTAMLVRKNASNDVVIKPPSLQKGPDERKKLGQSEQNDQNGQNDQNDQNDKQNFDINDHMSWLLNQFQELSLKENANFSKNDNKIKQIHQIEQNDEIDAFITHIRAKTRSQREKIIISSPQNSSHNNLSGDGNSIVSIDSPLTTANALALKEECLSPMKQKLTSYQQSNEVLINTMGELHSQVQLDRKKYEEDIQLQEKEILKLEKELETKRNQIQEEKNKLKLKHEQNQEEILRQYEIKKAEKNQKNNEENFKLEQLTLQLSQLALNSPDLLSPSSSQPQTPSKASNDLAQLHQSLSKAKSHLSTLNKRLNETSSSSSSSLTIGGGGDDDDNDLDLSMLKFHIDDDFDANTDDKAQQSLRRRPSFASQLDLDDETRYFLAEFTSNPNSNTKLDNMNDIDQNVNNTDENLIDITHLLLDTTKDLAVIPQTTHIETHLNSIPSLPVPKSPISVHQQQQQQQPRGRSSGTTTIPRPRAVNPTISTSTKVTPNGTPAPTPTGARTTVPKTAVGSQAITVVKPAVKAAATTASSAAVPATAKRTATATTTGVSTTTATRTAVTKSTATTTLRPSASSNTTTTTSTTTAKVSTTAAAPTAKTVAGKSVLASGTPIKPAVTGVRSSATGTATATGTRTTMTGTKVVTGSTVKK